MSRGTDPHFFVFKPWEAGYHRRMNLPEKFRSLFPVPPLTRSRMILALAIALAVDGLQLLFNAVGWFGLDQALDCIAMLLISRVIGFHVFLLPTFVVELVPLFDDLPTWAACTAAVIALRKRENHSPPPPLPPALPPPPNQ